MTPTPPIAGVSTAAAAFIGWSSQGHTEMAVEVESLREFVQEFGEPDARSLLGHAVRHFDPASATLFAWDADGPLVTEGPYAETKEHLAGFFIIDCATQERAQELAAQFAGPGSPAELRPVMWPDG